MSDDSKYYLTLGWQVTPTLEPKYWLKPEAKPGFQQEDDLVRVCAADTGSHMAIIAQSGSGKSFFLGRLIEELVLNTKARCLILDPNADFRQIHKIEGESLWTGKHDEDIKTKGKSTTDVKPDSKATVAPKGVSYDLIMRSGKLPHEESRSEFEGLWPVNEILIKTGSVQKGTNQQQLKLWWPSVSVDFFAGNADPDLRSQLYFCHTFVQNLVVLAMWHTKATGKSLDLIKVAESVLDKSRQSANFEAALKEHLDLDKILTVDPKKIGVSLGTVPAEVFTKAIKAVVTVVIGTASQTPKYVTNEGQRIYFATAHEYQSAGILETSSENVPQPGSDLKRIEVIDLPALKNKSTQLLAINAILKTEWDLARAAWSRALEQDEKVDTRVPTFIVVDEAHNLMPAEAEGIAEKALREQFRTIIAEGRKYGLFLILVSQRPDKLDPLIVSECENKVLMKLSSRNVLDKTRTLLGLDDIPTKILDRCLEFEQGRALLLGTWVPRGPQFMYSAPRRTKEGGRNLQKKHWAVPPDSPGKKQSEGEKKDKPDK